VRIVLDTNVLVSGIFFSGPPRQIVEAWTAGALQVVLSLEILEEYRRVAGELQSKFPTIDIRPILDFLLIHSEICLPNPLPAPVSADPDDDKFIECALSRGVKLIVSGDQDLLGVSGYEGIRVIRPRAFVERYL